MSRALGIVAVAILSIIVIAVLALMINHNIQLAAEARDFPPPGRIVEVNGKRHHVYTQGEGDITLVFMAGHGTSNPTLDFKPLWMRMVDEYRIAVVERSGYGWSETSDSPRDIDTLLEETRQALALAGEEPPYVLVPHSMSGLEALYWAQEYPDEVKAIIGLDPLTPETVDLIPAPSKTQLYAMFFISRIGLSRLMPESDVGESLPLMRSDDLSDEDREQYLAVFYRSTLTRDMLREVSHLHDNAETVARNEAPVDTPMVFFISADQDATVVGWAESLSDYLSQMTTGESMRLATGHYVHHGAADTIAEAAKAFLEDIE